MDLNRDPRRQPTLECVSQYQYASAAPANCRSGTSTTPCIEKPGTRGLRFQRNIAERIRPRPEWVVGDFGCGECLLAQALPGQRIIGLDHVAISTEVTACDMVATPLAAQSLDCAVFSLSLLARTGPSI